MTQIRGGILGIGKKCLNRVNQMITMALLVGAVVLAVTLTKEKKTGNGVRNVNICTIQLIKLYEIHYIKYFMFVIY